MPTYTGIFNTDQFVTDHAKKSFSSMITRLMPGGSAPLFGLTSMLPSETAVQVEHGFFTKTMVFPFVNLDAAVIDGVATTFTVADSSNILPGMILRAQDTGENVIVDSVPTATTITVTRSVGAVAGVAITDDTNLYQVGNAFEESSTRPQALNIIPVRITNLTQTFRNTWAISESTRATMMIAGESNVAESKQDAAAFHAVDIEKMLFFGQKSQSTRNGQPFRTAGGLYEVVGDFTNYPPGFPTGVPNLFTANATTNWTELEGMLDPMFDQVTDPKSGNERVMFLGGRAKVVVNNIGRLNGEYQLVDGQTNFGLRFSTLTTPRGMVRLVEHPLFNSNQDWSKMAVAVDLASFRVAYLGDRKTQHKFFNTSGNQAQDNGIDAVGGTLTTEMTTVIKNPPANSIIEGFTAAAVG